VPAEFVAELVSAMKSPGSGLFHLQGLNAADREDVLQAAVVWCWDNHAKFDPDRGSIAMWFRQRLKTQAFLRKRQNVTEGRRRSPRAPEEHERLSPDRTGGQRKTRDKPKYTRTGIDHAIETLLRRPRHARADCPPCWKCCYFAGWLPPEYAPSAYANPEIQAAVRAIEERKIEIARSAIER
jgi:hypothetical protein